MICEHCRKRTATAHITENINGVVSEMHLCSICALELGCDDFLNKESINGLLSSVFSPLVQNDFAGKRCTLCGKTLNAILSSGEAGCAECYKVFENELMAPIRKIHGKVRHIGKRPKGVMTEKTESDIVADKQKELQKAIDTQNFEAAALLRDEIRELLGGEKND